MIHLVQGFWCDAPDPNYFYGCDYPEIWKLTAISWAGVMGIAFLLSAMQAARKNPFKKLDVSEQRRLLASHDWNDIARYMEF